MFKEMFGKIKIRKLVATEKSVERFIAFADGREKDFFRYDEYCEKELAEDMAYLEGISSTLPNPERLKSIIRKVRETNNFAMDLWGIIETEWVDDKDD